MKQIVQLKVKVGNRTFSEDFTINGNDNYEDFKTKLKEIFETKLATEANTQVMFEETKQEWSRYGNHPYKTNEGPSLAERQEKEGIPTEGDKAKSKVGAFQAGKDNQTLTEKEHKDDARGKFDKQDESTLERRPMGGSDKGSAAGINQTDTNPKLENIDISNPKEVLKVQTEGLTSKESAKVSSADPKSAATNSNVATKNVENAKK